jgi:putative nucleotidyltransferase with HDIG domain
MAANYSRKTASVGKRRGKLREIEPLCCDPVSTTLSVSPMVQELTQRIAHLEAQSLIAVRDVRRLYQAEQEKRGELELARAQMLTYADELGAAYRQERARRAELERSYVEMVRALARAIDARDPYTGGHVDRVAAYATALARELGWNEDDLWPLEAGSLLHDIGKIAVADGILRKRGPLDEAEWVQMRQHPSVGAEMIRDLAALDLALPAVLYHHERYDGAGYPAGLIGEAIPRVARIVTVADAFDAMLTDRPYRKGLPLEVAIEELEKCSGSQFDPDCAGAFLEIAQAGRLKIVKAKSTSAA